LAKKTIRFEQFLNVCVQPDTSVNLLVTLHHPAYNTMWNFGLKANALSLYCKSQVQRRT